MTDRASGPSRVARWRSVLAHDGGRSAVAVVMAVLTFATAGVAVLQSDASSHSAGLERAADTRALEAASVDTSATVGQLRDIDVFRNWFAALQDAGWASRTGLPPGVEDDAALREDLARIDYELSEWLRTRSPLMQPPYYDPDTFYVDMPRYVAERAAETTRSVEQTRVDLATADAWGAKASAYVTILTVFAVSLFFLGIAATAAVGARRILLAAGLGLAVLGAGWTVAVVTSPVRATPPEAVDGVVRATVALSQTSVSGSETVDPAVADDFQTAIAAAETAVRLDAEYVSARRVAAEASLSWAFARMLSAEGRSTETLDLVRRSIAHYDAYLEASPSDPSGWWNAGFARYLADDAEGAIAAAAQVAELAPEQFVPWVIRAVAEIAAGRPDDAAVSLETAIATAASSNLDSNAYFFDQIDLNLTQLAGVRDGEADALRVVQRRLREARVAIRNTGTGLPSAAAAEVSVDGAVALRLGPLGSLDAGEPIDDGSALPGTDWAGVRLSVSGPAQEGSTLSVRVWRGLLHQAGFDVDIPWTGGSQTIDLVEPYGRAGLDFTAERYVVEVYVDGATRDRLEFEALPTQTAER